MESPLLKSNPGLKSALSDFEQRYGSQARSVFKLGGTGNSSFRVEFEHESVVLRLNANTAHLGVDRQQEKTIIEALQGTGITPMLRHWQPEYLVMDLIEAQTASVEAIARTLKHLHSLPVPNSLITSPPWTPLDTIRDYLQLCQTPMPRTQALAQQLTTALWTHSPYVVCHIDLNPTNILGQSDGDAILIDWEYARCGPAEYDLAVVIETHQFSPEVTDKFLAHYDNQRLSAQVSTNQFAYRIIELLWLHLTSPVDWPSTRIEAITADMQIPA